LLFLGGLILIGADHGNRFTVTIKSVWSGPGYVLSKDTVNILTEEEK
jgi:hypothetical protein